MTPDKKNAIPLRSVDGAMVSKDGSQTLFQVTTDKGGQYLWALPSDALEGMMIIVSAMVAQAARIRGDDAKARQGLPVENWSMARNEDGTLWMAMTFAGGATQAVRLPEGSAAQMHRILGAMLEQEADASSNLEEASDSVH
jgi:hypothetical protein